MSSRPAWSAEQHRQIGRLHRETLTQKKPNAQMNKKKKRKIAITYVFIRVPQLYKSKYIFSLNTLLLMWSKVGRESFQSPAMLPVDTLVPSYGSAVPEGVPIRVMTSQSMVLSGEGAKVSEITPRKSDNPFFTFSVAPEEPSVCRENQREEDSVLGAGCIWGPGETSQKEHRIRDVQKPFSPSQTGGGN